VPIPRSLIDALVAQATGKKSEDVLFSSSNSEPIRLANWRQRVWESAIAAAGLSGLTPHDLRHTAASLAIASGASVKHIQRMLGHKDAAMTLNVYASLFEDDLDDVSNRLDAALLEVLRPVCGLSPQQRSSSCLSGLPEHCFH
jgi:integrase